MCNKEALGCLYNAVAYVVIVELSSKICILN